MAGRTEYVIAHPNGEDHIRAPKGGKVPTYATWAFFPEGSADGSGWEHLGWSFQATLEDAQKKALPDIRKHGGKVTATQVIPTR